MYKSRSNNRQASLFWDLETMLDPKHPLFKLANMVNWSCFEEAFAPLFCADNGRPPKPIRLMVGLLMLKHLRNVSDELILKESIRINLAIEDKKKEEEDKKNKKDSRGGKNDEDQTAFIDSTVQEKNIIYADFCVQRYEITSYKVSKLIIILPISTFLMSIMVVTPLFV